MLILAGALCACATPEPATFAYRANTSNSDKAMDDVDCQIEATNRVAPNVQLATTPTYITPTYFTPMTTSCYGGICTTTGGQIQGGQTYGGETYSYDANSQLRESAVDQCMMRKGYQLISSRTCTASEAQVTPAVSPSAMIVRPSGTFCVAQSSTGYGVPLAVVAQ